VLVFKIGRRPSLRTRKNKSARVDIQIGPLVCINRHSVRSQGLNLKTDRHLRQTQPQRERESLRANKANEQTRHSNACCLLWAVGSIHSATMFRQFRQPHNPTRLLAPSLSHVFSLPLSPFNTCSRSLSLHLTPALSPSQSNHTNCLSRTLQAIQCPQTRSAAVRYQPEHLQKRPCVK